MEVFETLNSAYVKKTLVMLKIMRGIIRYGYEPNQAFEWILEFEQELIDFRSKSEAVNKCFAAAQLYCMPHTSTMYGGEILAKCADFKPVTELAKDTTFDINRIQEIIKLFEKLVRLKIDKVCISGEAKFERIKPSWCTSSSTPTFDKRSVEKQSINDAFSIFKTFSNAEIDYNTNSGCNAPGEHFGCEFSDEPTWAICGSVIYYRDGKIYLGRSSPHTQFDFHSTSLYVDPRTLPTSNALYSPNETDSLRLYKSRNINNK